VKPRLLDLFCGAGGATRGYQRAGFWVQGIDIIDQPNYVGDDFYRMDALDAGVYGFDAIHASPPCQAFTAYRRRGNGVGDRYPDLIDDTRQLLEDSGRPYVIENVPGAPLRNHVQLCGTSFGLDVRRHRWFESNIAMLAPPCNHDQPRRFPAATNRTNLRRTVEVGVWRIPLEVQQQAMGIDWMTLPELTEAIPPAYTQWIGEQLLASLVAVAGSATPTGDDGG
jgi:DNA (cytosine-5)-methyltransferase 1